MKRTQLNFVIDAVAFAAFVALLSTGLLLNNRLPPGSGGLHGMGSGHGAGERELVLLWGWTRHEWGAIHLWIAYALVAVLAVHLVLHWNWIACMVRGKRSESSGMRWGLGLVSALALLVLCAMPLWTPTETTTRDELRQRTAGTASDSASRSVPDLRGSMTLRDVAAEVGRPTAQLIDQLGLPESVPIDEPVGRVLRRNGLRMSDLRRAMEVGDEGEMFMPR